MLLTPVRIAVGAEGCKIRSNFYLLILAQILLWKTQKKTLYSCKTCGIILCNLDEGGEFNTWPLLPAPLHSCSQPQTARGCSPEESAQAKLLLNVALQHTDPRRVLGLLLWEMWEYILLLIKRGKEFRGQLERFGQVPTEDTWNEWNWMN